MAGCLVLVAVAVAGGKIEGQTKNHSSRVHYLPPAKTLPRVSIGGSGAPSCLSAASYLRATHTACFPPKQLLGDDDES
jgi:hypothetical protein